MVSQPPMCLACEKTGARLSAPAKDAQDIETDQTTGMLLVAGSIAALILLLILPANPGSSGSRLRLAGFALAFLLAPGLAKLNSARRHRKSRK